MVIIIIRDLILATGMYKTLKSNISSTDEPSAKVLE